MSYLNGLCPHGHPTVKTRETRGPAWATKPDETRVWTHEFRPVEKCAMCREAVQSGRSSVLESYVVGEDSGTGERGK